MITCVMCILHSMSHEDLYIAISLEIMKKIEFCLLVKIYFFFNNSIIIVIFFAIIIIIIIILCNKIKNHNVYEEKTSNRVWNIWLPSLTQEIYFYRNRKYYKRVDLDLCGTIAPCTHLYTDIRTKTNVHRLRIILGVS